MYLPPAHFSHSPRALPTCYLRATYVQEANGDVVDNVQRVAPALILPTCPLVRVGWVPSAGYESGCPQLLCGAARLLCGAAR